MAGIGNVVLAVSYYDQPFYGKVCYIYITIPLKYENLKATQILENLCKIACDSGQR